MKALAIKKTAYTDVGVNAFPGVYSEIIMAILNNPATFTNLPIPALTLEDSMVQLLEKTNKAKKGSDLDKTQRAIQAEICLGYLATLSAYVLQMASTKSTLEQQIEVVQLSKFTLVKQPVPTPPIAQVEGVKGTWTGINGQAIVEWNRADAGVVAYNVYKCFTQPENPSNWEFAGTTTRKKLVLTDLPNLGQVYVQVVAVKEGVSSAPSEPVMVGITAI